MHDAHRQWMHPARRGLFEGLELDWHRLHGFRL
jgi:hypothetical protein